MHFNIRGSCFAFICYVSGTLSESRTNHRIINSYESKGKGKRKRKRKRRVHPETGHKVPEVEQSYNSTLSLTPAALPSGKTRYLFYRRLGGPQGRSRWVQKISPLTGIRSPDRPARSPYPGPHYKFLY